MFQASPTLEVLARALDVSALRHAVYSANFANANVEGYRRLEVMFDAQAMRVETAAGVPNGANGAQVIPTDATVKLDQEMATLVRNALNYQTLLDAYERSASIMKMAVREGKG